MIVRLGIVIAPAFLRLLDVSYLTALVASAKNNNRVAINAKVDSVPGPFVNPQLENTVSHGLTVSMISVLFDASESCTYGSAGLSVNFDKPTLKRTLEISGEVVLNGSGYGLHWWHRDS